MILTAFDALEIRNSLRSELMVALAQLPAVDQYGSVAESVLEILSGSLDQNKFEEVRDALTSTAGRNIAANVATVLEMGEFFEQNGVEVGTDNLLEVKT